MTYVDIIFVVVLVLIFILFSLFVYGEFLFWFTFHRSESHEFVKRNTKVQEMMFLKDKEWFTSIPKKIVSIKAYDKTTLKAAFIEYIDSHKYFIVVHGYHGSYSDLSPMAHKMNDQGFNILMICLRGHSISGGYYFTMGAKEKIDIKSWIEYIVSIDPSSQIAIEGISMGASSTMFALGLSLPVNLKCAIEDCGYSSIRDQLEYSMKNFIKFIPKKFSLGILEIISRLHGFSINENVESSLKNCACPLLLIHGEKDNFVPYKFLKRNIEAINKNQVYQVESFKDAGHSSSIGTEPERYFSVIINFVNKFIK